MEDFFKDVKDRMEIYSVPIQIPDEIPDEIPKYTVSFEERFARMEREPKTEQEMRAFFEQDFSGTSKEMRLKEAYNGVGMYAFVSWKWVNPFVEWINGRKCLEVMAGRGWLSHALRLKGVDVIATDDYSWSNNRGWKEPLTEVIDADAVESVNLFGKQIDILIMAWPYMDNTAFKVIKRLYEVNPTAIVVYIGEGPSGCTADKEFHDHFEEVDDEKFYPVVRNYQQWYAIYDYPVLGRYKEEE